MKYAKERIVFDFKYKTMRIEMEKINLESNGRDLSFFLTKKSNIKRINLRVKEDLNIYVSAPKGVKREFISSFVSDSADWIEGARERIAKANDEKKLKAEKNKNRFLYLGQSYKIVFKNSNVNSVTLYDGAAYVYGKNSLGKDKILENYLRQKGIGLIYTMLEEMGDILKTVGLCGFPEIKLRKMKSRWGSCHYTKNKIVLNTELFKKDIICIKYVLIHELCHFRQPNHSREFYDLLSSFMPEWKEIKRQLNSE